MKKLDVNKFIINNNQQISVISDWYPDLNIIGLPEALSNKKFPFEINIEDKQDTIIIDTKSPGWLEELMADRNLFEKFIIFLIKDFYTLYIKLSSMEKLLYDTQRLIDVTTLICWNRFIFLKSSGNTDGIEKIIKLGQNAILKYGDQLIKRLQNNNFTFPDELSPAFFNIDLKKVLNKKYGLFYIINKNLIDKELFKIISFILTDNQDRFISFLEKNHFSIHYLIKKYELMYNVIIKHYKIYLKKIQKNLNIMFYHRSSYYAFIGLIVLQTFTQQSAENKLLSIHFINRYIELENDYIKRFIKIFNHKPKYDLNYYNKISEKLMSVVSKFSKLYKEKEDKKNLNIDDRNIIDISKEMNIYDNIDQLKEYIQNAKSFYNGNDFSKENISYLKENCNLYFEFYINVWKYIQTHSEQPLKFEQFINCGIIDDDFVPEQNLEYIYKNYNLMFSEETNMIKTYHANEWFEKIFYADKSTTQYNKNLEIETNSHTVELNEEISPDINLNQEILYNFGNIINKLNKDFINPLPFLNFKHVRGKFENNIVTKCKIEKNVEKLNNKDFSLFFKPIHALIEHRKYDLYEIKKPDFVIIPIQGNNPEVIITDNYARIFLPLILQGIDIDSLIQYAVALFKWRSLKNFAGLKWNDPLDGGFTGRYFYFVNNIKKNPKINLDQRTKLLSTYKKFDSIEEKFIHDYTIWFNDEIEGRNKLHPLLKELFLDYFPFKKPVLDELETYPFFKDLIQRYKNKKSQNLKKLQNKIDKFEKLSEEIKILFQNTLFFYKN